MDTKTRTLILTISIAPLAWLVPHAASNGSFEEPSTYIGIAVGALLVAVAWAVGRRRDSEA